MGSQETLERSAFSRELPTTLRAVLARTNENKKDALLRRRPSKSHFGNSSDVHRSISFDFDSDVSSFGGPRLWILSPKTQKKDIESTDVSQYVPLCKCHVRETASVGCADGDNFHPSKKGLSQRSGNSAAQ